MLLHTEQKKKALTDNYRPISFTSVFGKLMETIIHDKLMIFLEENILTKNTQHGFRTKHPCLTNLLEFSNDVINIYDETKTVYIIYLDFQRTFDKCLLKKSESHGIAGKTLKCLAQRLASREYPWL